MSRCTDIRVCVCVCVCVYLYAQISFNLKSFGGITTKPAILLITYMCVCLCALLCPSSACLYFNVTVVLPCSCAAATPYNVIKAAKIMITSLKVKAKLSKA
ncbi:unnamed protein product [Ceratitis capitata]|uniref:(Mediterranean fruit fly) hypothetical protein n=1 Tax=Ceratitis capitata TaxID=7213 RepID=A0A811VE39_CERCA|nr:unnamed protein product [Ceratitis capitata]